MKEREINYCWKCFIVLFMAWSSPISLEAQKEYVLTTPSRITSVSGTSGVDPSDLISFIAESLSLYGGASCLDDINLQKDSRIKAEMKTLKSEKPYVLVLSFKECKFISLFPKEENGKWKDGIWLDPNWTVFHITLYPDLQFLKNNTDKSDNNTTDRALLVATYQNKSGFWEVLHPYGLSDPQPTENQALSSVFYSESDLKFLCKRDKYKIYELTVIPEGTTRSNVRELLRSFGIYDIP